MLPFGRSLAGRLALLQIASIVCFLLVASLLLYRELRRDLDQQDAAFASEKVEVLRRILRDSDRPEVDLRPEVSPPPSSVTFPGYWVRVVDHRGSVIVETPGAYSLFQRLRPLVSPSLASEHIEITQQRKISSGESFLVGTGRASTGDGSACLIQIAVSKNDDDRVMAHYRETMLAVLILAALSSIPVALYLTRRGLQPLEQMTERARTISASRLHERVRAEQWPGEVAELATAFDDMLERLQRSFTQLSQFSADLAHELRTPVNNMLGELEVSLYAERTPEEYRDVLASMLEEGSRLNRIVDGLLFLARAEGSERRIDRQSLRAAGEISAVAEFFEALTEQKKIQVICRGDAPLYGEPTLVRRALTNLLGNAVRYTPEGGTVILEARPLDDGTAVIEIRDNGAGIPREHLSRIFDRFYRADPSRTASAEGTGLGLSIVQTIMELHGGSVTIESELGRGTTARLAFPPRG